MNAPALTGKPFEHDWYEVLSEAEGPAWRCHRCGALWLGSHYDDPPATGCVEHRMETTQPLRGCYCTTDRVWRDHAGRNRCGKCGGILEVEREHPPDS